MHTTTPGKGKGKLIKIDEQLMKKLPTGFEGAYNTSFYYEAYMESVKKWFKARILACRLA